MFVWPQAPAVAFAPPGFRADRAAGSRPLAAATSGRKRVRAGRLARPPEALAQPTGRERKPNHLLHF